VEGPLQEPIRQINKQRVFKKIVTMRRYLLPRADFSPVVDRDGPHVIEASIAIVAGEDPQLVVVDSSTMCGPRHRPPTTVRDIGISCSKDYVPVILSLRKMMQCNLSLYMEISGI